MNSSSIRVFTFKEGLLSPLAHDLALRLGRFTLGVTGGVVNGRFELASLEVEGAVKRGRVAEGTLSANDRATIERTLREILHVAREPAATFTGSVAGHRAGSTRVSGELTLAGRTQPLDAEIALGPRLRAEVEFAPSSFGIPPYRALGGAIKLQDRVRVELDVDAGGIDLTDPYAVDARFDRQD